MNSFLKFCPNCENFPTLCINRTQINIKCKCGYAQVISIKDYLNQLKKCNSLHCITKPKFVKITDKITAGYTHLLTYFKEIKDNGSNPKTGDNIMLYVAIASMSIIGLGATTIVAKKKKMN